MQEYRAMGKNVGMRVLQGKMPQS